MSVDRIGNTPRQANVISADLGYRTYRDRIGDSDRNDYFRFNLSDRRSYNVALSGLTLDANLQLLNASGRVLLQSVRPGRSRELIQTTLEAGTYFLRVFPARRGKGTTAYRLAVSATTPPPLEIDNAGNSLAQANDLGTVEGNRVVQDRIGGGDPNDYYRFSLTQFSQLTLNLDTLQGEVSLLQSDGTRVSGSLTSSRVGQAGTWELAAGTYYIQVASLSLQNSLTYALTLNATGDRAGNSRDQALNLGTLTNTQTLTNWLSDLGNREDYYRFNLSRDVNLALTLDTLGQSNTIFDLLDSNGTALKVAWGAETVKSISQDLTAGTYYIHVQGSRDYHLTLNLPIADLVATAFDVPEALTVGSDVTTHFQIQNLGAEAVGTFRVNFYLSSDPQITQGDRLLGQYDINGLGANGSTGLLNTVLALPDANDLFWQTNGTYYIGMMVDPLRVIREADERNNVNQGDAIDQDEVNISGLPSSHLFNIEFDYSSDAIGWFTPPRRAALEAAARIWEKIIQTDVLGAIDLTINVIADELGGTTAGRAWINSDFDGTGSIEFDLTTNWFFDATPNTADDIPSSDLDFISVALHEIGHSLGFSGVDNQFNSQVVNGTFAGNNAKAYNGGNPIPLSPEGSHIRASYEFGNSGAPLMNPFVVSGTRVLPTLLDLAILDDIRYTVNYGAASQNRSSNSVSSQPLTYAQCGCAACMTNSLGFVGTSTLINQVLG